MSVDRVNRRFKLIRRPQGLPTAADFQHLEEPVPELADGEFLVRNHFVSLSPAMRGWMDDKPSYLPPIPLGAPVRANSVGVVAESRNSGFPVGQWVLGMHAIEDYSLVANGGSTKPIDQNAVPSVTNYLSVVGVSGLTAYFALLEVGRPRRATPCW
jgi:NADPH-dependent curcumin reductase CurA